MPCSPCSEIKEWLTLLVDVVDLDVDVVTVVGAGEGPAVAVVKRKTKNGAPNVLWTISNLTPT